MMKKVIIGIAAGVVIIVGGVSYYLLRQRNKGLVTISESKTANRLDPDKISATEVLSQFIINGMEVILNRYHVGEQLSKSKSISLQKENQAKRYFI